ncbi:hypothetical protein C8R43DRAFT_1142744 [Mycena crocata]|nr:hypothetical protein C8R43DRAFT_1142744 [Mycena crocata]
MSNSNALDESDLARWQRKPPFEADDDERDTYSPEYQQYTTSLITVLHGVKMREQNEKDHLRRKEFKVKGWDRCLESLRAEVEQQLMEWEHLTNLNIYHPYHHPREWATHWHQIQWRARTIYHLYYLKFLK